MLFELKKVGHWWCQEAPVGGNASAETRDGAIRNMWEIRSDAERRQLLEAAENWRYLAFLACAGRGDAFQVRHSKRISHTDLDTWLTERFVRVGAFGEVLGFRVCEARAISNHVMDLRDFTTGADGVRWLNKRSEPTWLDYPELAERWEVDDEAAT